MMSFRKKSLEHGLFFFYYEIYNLLYEGKHNFERR